MAQPVKTLEVSLKEARSLVAMYKDLIANGERREAAIQDEINELQERLDFLKRSRLTAPESLVRAEKTLNSLELTSRRNQATGGRMASRATLQRKADRAESLASQIKTVMEQLKAKGLSQEEIHELLEKCDE